MESHPFVVSAAPLSFVSSANLLKVSLIKVLKSTVPFPEQNPEGYLLDIEPLTTALWLCGYFPDSSPFKPMYLSLEMRMSHGTVSKFLRKSKYLSDIGCPLVVPLSPLAGCNPSITESHQIG